MRILIGLIIQIIAILFLSQAYGSGHEITFISVGVASWVFSYFLLFDLKHKKNGKK